MCRTKQDRVSFLIYDILSNIIKSPVIADSRAMARSTSLRLKIEENSFYIIRKYKKHHRASLNKFIKTILNKQ